MINLLWTMDQSLCAFHELPGCVVATLRRGPRNKRPTHSSRLTLIRWEQEKSLVGSARVIYLYINIFTIYSNKYTYNYLAYIYTMRKKTCLPLTQIDTTTHSFWATNCWSKSCCQVTYLQRRILNQKRRRSRERGIRVMPAPVRICRDVFGWSFGVQQVV